MDDLRRLQDWIDESDRIVFFGGAGVSTESGIPDFRSTDGLYYQHFSYPPEQMLSHSFFETHPEEFFGFYKEKVLALDAVPNAAHEKLAMLEQSGRLTGVVTQNIDGLHQKAGSETVFELHGSVHRNYCTGCGAFYDGQYIRMQAGVPKCRYCGQIVKPDVVLYEEPLDEKVVEGAIAAIAAADLLIVGGTSLVVYPAAGLLRYFSGRKTVLINKSTTQMDQQADLVIRMPIGAVFSGLRI